MELNGKTRNDISEALGISYFTVSDWVKGKTYPRMDKVEMLAEYFGILKSDLIENKSEEHREMQKNNDALADIVVKLRTDKKFLSIVSSISNLDDAELQKVESILALLK
jgi:transcriptional regulator with XRE-family HTH domain